MKATSRPRRAGALLVTAIAVTMLASGCTWVSVGSRTIDGSDPTGPSIQPALDNAGNYMVFQSDASNLVAGDTNGVTDVFKVDNVKGHVERPSVASDGTQANAASRNPDIDCCGGLITFESDASNLVPNDTNGVTDIFVHNQTTKVTMLISVASDGGPANGPSTHPSISSDGKWIAFESTATNIVPGVSGHQVYARPWQTTGPTRLVSAATCVNGTVTGGNGDSTRPRLSGDGTTVTFTSTSTNFNINPGNSSPNAYVAPTSGCGASTVPALVGYDTAGQIPAHGTVATSIERKGQFVAFDSYATACPGSCTVGGVFVRDRNANSTTAVAPGDPNAAGGWLNDSGNTIAIQASGPNGVSPVAAVVVVATGATRVISTDLLVHPRAIQPVVDPTTDGPRLARFTGYFAYTASVANVWQVLVQTTVPEPVVSSVSPPGITRGASNVTLTISGNGFAAGSVVSPPAGVTVDSTTFVNASTLQVTVHVASNAPTGSAGLSVGVPGGLGLYYGSLGSCSGCLTIN